MSRRTAFPVSWTMAILLSFVAVENCQSQEGQPAGFATPKRGDTITKRGAFPVSLNIPDFDVDARYWVAIAAAGTHDQAWEDVLALYELLKSSHNDAKKAELINLIKDWEIGHFWPKFHVPKSHYKGDVYDGGSNPLHGLEPQPMVLLVLKTDDKMHQKLKGWLRDGEAGKGYPGIPSSTLNEDMIIARCEIFFP